MHYCRLKTRILFILMLCHTVTALAVTDKPTDPNTLDTNLFVYLWTPNISLETGPTSRFKLPYSDLLSAVKAAFMGGFDASYKHWQAYADYIYINLSADLGNRSTPVAMIRGELVGPNDIVTANLTLNLANVTLGYDLYTSNRLNWNALAGWRYLSFTGNSNFTISTPVQRVLSTLQNFANPPTVVRVPDTVSDIIVGTSGYFRLTDTWFVPVYADVGKNQSKYTWQVKAGIGHAYSWGNINVQFREIEWRFDPDTVLTKFALHGIMIGVVYHVDTSWMKA